MALIEEAGLAVRKLAPDRGRERGARRFLYMKKHPATSVSGSRGLRRNRHAYDAVLQQFVVAVGNPYFGIITQRRERNREAELFVAREPISDISSKDDRLELELFHSVRLDEDGFERVVLIVGSNPPGDLRRRDVIDSAFHLQSSRSISNATNRRFADDGGRVWSDPVADGDARFSNHRRIQENRQ